MFLYLPVVFCWCWSRQRGDQRSKTFSPNLQIIRHYFDFQYVLVPVGLFFMGGFGGWVMGFWIRVSIIEWWWRMVGVGTVETKERMRRRMRITKKGESTNDTSLLLCTFITSAFFSVSTAFDRVTTSSLSPSQSSLCYFSPYIHVCMYTSILILRVWSIYRVISDSHFFPLFSI